MKSIFYLGSLSSFVRKYKEPVSGRLESDDMIMDLDALDTGKFPSFPLGTTGSIGWNGEVSSLRR